MTYHIVAWNNEQTRIIMSKTETDNEDIRDAAIELYKKQGHYPHTYTEG